MSKKVKVTGVLKKGLFISRGGMCPKHTKLAQSEKWAQRRPADASAVMEI